MPRSVHPRTSSRRSGRKVAREILATFPFLGIHHEYRAANLFHVGGVSDVWPRGRGNAGHRGSRHHFYSDFMQSPSPKTRRIDFHRLGEPPCVRRSSKGMEPGRSFRLTRRLDCESIRAVGHLREASPSALLRSRCAGLRYCGIRREGASSLLSCTASAPVLVPDLADKCAFVFRRDGAVSLLARLSRPSPSRPFPASRTAPPPRRPRLGTLP